VTAEAIVESLLENDFEPKDWIKELPAREYVAHRDIVDYVAGYVLDYAQRNHLNRAGFNNAVEKVVDVLVKHGAANGPGKVDVFDVFWAMEQAGCGSAAEMENEFFAENE
jgi:hypothetical protein